MKILVIGGNGFIGSKVSLALSKKGYNVTIFDKKKNKELNKKIKFIYGDIRSQKSLLTSIKGKDAVFNFAALSDIDEARNMPSETIILNILAVSNILISCKKMKIKRFIQASTIYASSEEGGFYARSKRAAEDYILEFNKIYNTNYTILRFGSLYGSGADSNNGIKKLILSGKKNKKLIYRGSVKATRRYINVEDAAELCVYILNKKFKNKVINITGRTNIKIKHVLNFLSKKLGIEKKNIIYKNEKNTGHYSKKPTPVKLITSKNLYIKKEKNIYKTISTLIND